MTTFGTTQDDGAGVPADVVRGTAPVERSRLHSLVPFAVLSLLCVLSLALGMGLALSSFLTRAVSDWEWGNTAALVRREIEMTGLDRRLSGTHGAEGRERWGRELARLLTSLPEVVRVKAWDTNATVIWSDEPNLIGRRFPDNPELRTALTGRVEVEIREPKKSEQRYERGASTKLAEVYVPILSRDTGQIVAVVEVYKVPTRLLETIRRGRIVVWSISLVGGVVLYVVMVPLFTHIYRREVEERTLRAHAGRLATEVAQRTDQLRRQSERLLQAQKIEAVGRLAGGIAHDFNNLLTVILGRTELALTQRRAEGPLRHELELIKETAGRAAELTRQLLAFSRKQVLELKVVDLNGIVANMSAMLRRLIGEDIELVTDLDRGAAWIRADPAQIEQVIVNLIVNARDAMPRGGRLTIATTGEALDDAGLGGSLRSAHTVLSITDTGDGMTPEVKARIFEPFFTTKAADKGTGLGLATAYGIVKQHGGYIEVDSEVGRGTAFRINLPRAESPAPTAAGEAAPEALATGSEVVLVVEDETPVKSLLRKVLQAGGYSVLEAASGLDAIELGSRHRGPLDLLLTDVVMPGMSGTELAGHLGRERPDLRILYTSGYTDDAVLGAVAESPFLPKPFTPDELLRAVRDVLDKAAAGELDAAGAGRRR